MMDNRAWLAARQAPVAHRLAASTIGRPDGGRCDRQTGCRPARRRPAAFPDGASTRLTAGKTATEPGRLDVFVLAATPDTFKLKSSPPAGGETGYTIFHWTFDRAGRNHELD